ncbi:MAG: PHP domain-containing protein [Chloroflexi bacterium]|nr:PHP domain-containing protein [Chloroflexota bacterium]
MKLSTADLVLARDAAIDLQTHTIYSDGVWLPDQLIDYLAGEGFGLAAITDHDRVDTLVSLQRLALEKGFPLLVAVEMTTTWKGELVDILCYGFDPENNYLAELAQDVARRQRENTMQVCNFFHQQGYTLAEDEITAILDLPGSGQPFALAALLKKGGYETPGKMLREAGCDFATSDPAAVVDAAHRSSAVALIAHPGRSDGFVCFDTDLLDELRRDVPVDGLEVYYPAHAPEQMEMYREYAEKHGLLTSSGSDSHGPDKKPIKYPAQLSRNLLERLGIQVK